jgi:hypothetical protein
VRDYVESIDSGVPTFAADGIVLHDPRAGRVEGVEAFRDFVETTSRWLDECKARTEWLATTATPGRAVGELVAHLMLEGRDVHLPIAVVAEQKSDHAEFRVYYTQWPLHGSHTIRPPILMDSGAEPTGWPGKYHAALTEGDADAIAEVFEDDGYVREPTGPDYMHGGKDIHPFFKTFFSVGGGIELEHCAITDDGTRCCLEYNCVRWGATKLPPQAGIGIYERGATGKLHAARIYDDVEPPLPG